MSKVPVTYEYLCNLATHARRVGTLDAFADVALQWAGLAEKEIERLRADLEREQLRLAACGVVALANTPESAAKARQMHDDYRSASCDDVVRAVDREMALRAALVAAMEIVQKERTRIAYNAKGAPPAIYDGYADIMRRLDAVIAQADAALGAERD